MGDGRFGWVEFVFEIGECCFGIVTSVVICFKCCLSVEHFGSPENEIVEFEID